jgi:trehalose 6-phosphate phosphatase
MAGNEPGVETRIAQAERLWLFLDYDGTLADFAPTPEHVVPDPDLIALLARLVREPRFRVTVVSGRRLAHVEKLVPLPEIVRAGTYGLELRLPGGGRFDRLDYDAIRPVLAALKPGWERLLDGHDGFFLEDKGWSLALHAKLASASAAERVLPLARDQAQNALKQAPEGTYRLLGGHRFLEIGPTLAHKGRTVAYLLEQDPWPGALPLYLGDDDKDEAAFAVIKRRGGIAIVVARESRPTRADKRLNSPQAARRWLAGLLGS